MTNGYCRSSFWQTLVYPKEGATELVFFSVTPTKFYDRNFILQSLELHVPLNMEHIAEEAKAEFFIGSRLIFAIPRVGKNKAEGFQVSGVINDHQNFAVRLSWRDVVSCPISEGWIMTIINGQRGL